MSAGAWSETGGTWATQEVGRGNRPLLATALLAALLASGVFALAVLADDRAIDLPIEKPVRGRALEPAPPVAEQGRAGERKPEPPRPDWWDPPPAEEPTRELPAPPPENEVEFFGEVLRGDRIVYVLDRSGSMATAYDGRTRWEVVRDETLRSIRSLPESMAFDIVVFSTLYWPMWGDVRAAVPGAKAEAEAFLAALAPGGGTLTGPATAWAVDHYATTKVFALLSDGLARDAAMALALIDRCTDPDQKIHTFGLDLGGGGEDWLIDVAAATGGNYCQVR